VLHLLEAVLHLLEAVLHLLEAVLHLLEAVLHLLEAVLHLLEMLRLRQQLSVEPLRIPTPLRIPRRVFHLHHFES
jgi:hypothetical protein